MPRPTDSTSKASTGIVRVEAFVFSGAEFDQLSG